MGWLAFLSHPAFVLPWYAVGAVSAAWVAYDLRHTNTVLMKAMQWAWPIVVFFFSVLGLALYFASARAPGVAEARDEREKKKLFDDYERSMLRRVNGAVIHCVAGDGLGIMTGMAIARVLAMTFWQEFWFEYAVGFAFGWFIFQYKSMTMMTDSKLRALAMAFRAEFFSMLTVMGGMGAVMAFVTPAVVGMQPKPWTAAFWGFGALGLMVGYVFTFPMNWMIVKIGWKHGMGSPEGARPAHGRGPRMALFGAMCVLGLAATVLPGWLAVQTQRHGMQVTQAAVARFTSSTSGDPLQRGLGASIAAARDALARGRRSEATAALDAAMRAAQVAHVAGLPPGAHAEIAVRQARRALQDGNVRQAESALAGADSRGPGEGHARAPSAGEDYADAELLDGAGAVIGKVRRVEGDRALLAVGGVQDFWGFWDFGDAQLAWVPLDGLVLGPAHTVGKTYALVPSLREPELALADVSR
jgi:hypothetical protein